MSYTILHNPRCRKSREWLKVLEEAGVDFEIREYLKDPLSKWELETLAEQLGISPIEFTRTKEADFKLAGLTKNSSDEEIIFAMVKYPKLIERPIVIKDNKKAVLGRPAEKIVEIINYTYS